MAPATTVALLLEDDNFDDGARASAARGSGGSAARSSRLSAADRLSLREHGSSWTVFVWDSFLLMFGGTQLGYAMGQMGWAWGSFWLLFSIVSTFFSGHILGELCNDTGAGSYPELGYEILGRFGEILVSFMQWAGYYLTGVVQIAFTGAVWDQTFAGAAFAAPICAWQWMLITFVVLLPLMQIPAFTQFGALALVASVVTLYSTAVYLAEIVQHGAYSGGRDSGWPAGVALPCYDQVTTAGMLAAVPNMAFTFSGHGTFPEQIRELRDPGEFHRGFNVLYGLAVPFYALCALLAMWAFGNMNSANFLENLSDTTALRVGMYLGLFLNFPGVVLGQVVLMLKVELPLGVLPIDWWVSTSDAHRDSRAAALVRRVPPVLFRAVFRTCYLGSLLVVAEALIGAGLAVYVNIAGSLGLAAMTFWMPYLLWLCRCYQRGAPRSKAARLRRGALALFYTINATGGVFISLTGLWYNLDALALEAAAHQLRWFHELHCKEGAHFWGSEMWDPSLPVNSTAYQTLIVGCCVNGTSCGA